MKTKFLTIVIIFIVIFTQAQTLVNKNNLVISNGTEMVLLCHLDNDGTITANQSNFKFASSVNQDIDGDNNIAFYNLSIDKTAGDLITKRK